MNPKRHHYVPEFLQKKFQASCDRRKPHIWVASKEDVTVSLRSIKDNACERFLYSVVGPDQIRNNVQEEYLRQWDGKMAEVFKRWESLAIGNSAETDFLEQDVIDLVNSVTLTILRTQRSIDTTHEVLQLMGLEGMAGPNVSRERAMLSCFHMQKVIYPVLREKCIRLILAPAGEEFITSDTPVAVVSGRQIVTFHAPAAPDAEVWFPLLPRVGVLFFTEPSRYIGMSAEKAALALNRLMAHCARREVYMSSNLSVVSAWIREANQSRLDPGTGLVVEDRVRNRLRQSLLDPPA